MKAQATPKPPSEEFSFLGRIKDGDLADYGPSEEELLEAGEEKSGEDTPAPSKKKRKEPAPQRTDLMVGLTVIGVGMLVLAGVGFVAWQYLPGLIVGGGSRLAWMPDDIEGFAEINPEEFWEAKATRPMREAKSGVNLRKYIEKLLSPVELSNVERIGVGFPPAGSPHPEPVFVLHAKSSFDAASLLSQAQEFSKATHGEQTYYIGRQPPRAVYFPSSSLLVYSTEEQIKSAIDRGGVCAAADKFDLPGYGTVVFAGNNPQRFGIPNLSSVAGHELGLSADAGGLTGMSLSADADFLFKMKGMLTYESADSATALVQKINDHVQEKIKEMEFQRSEKLTTDPTFKLNVGGAKQMFTAQQELLKSFEIRQSETQVEMEFTLPSFLFEVSYPMFESLAAGQLPDAGLFEDADEPE